MSKQNQEPLTIKVRFFAAAREHTGVSTIDIPVKRSTCLGQLRTIISNQYPEIKPLLPYLRWAVNTHFSTDDELVLNSGDEVALIPPISGG